MSNYISKVDIVDAFRKCNIQPGSVLMLHSDAIFLAQTSPMSKKDRLALFFEALKDVLGPEGTLVIPTYTYSATKNETFVVEETPSTVGDITEYFRKLPYVLRSKDPIFSVAVFGAKAEEFANAKFFDTFGSGSVFELLDSYNAWIACLACSIDRITFTHYVEQLFCVDYRYYKNFYYKVINKGSTLSGIQRYFVRNLELQTDTDLSELEKKLICNNKLFVSSIGRFKCKFVLSKCFKSEAIKMLSYNQNSLIKAGNKVT